MLKIIDNVVRFASVWFFLVTCATFFSLPLYVIKCISSSEKVEERLFEKLKRLIALCVLLLNGIELSIEGEDIMDQLHGVPLIFLNHTSFMDIFILSYLCPFRVYSIAKNELFLIPFFSWLLLLFDTVPIDRKNRDAAIETLKKITNDNENKMIAVFPEGTRSTTGMLQEFKKGPFYLVKDCKKDICPVVIFGAFELNPPGSLCSTPGKVYARVLPLVKYDETKTRDSISTYLRKMFLKSMSEPPKNAGKTVTYTRCYLFLMSLMYICFSIWKTVNLNLLYFSIVSVLVTLYLYVYNTRRN